jgi:hypothetical protein
MGCAVACVASVTGLKYATALRLFDGLRGDDRTLGFSRKAVLSALRRAGYAYLHRRFAPLCPARGRAATVPDRAIVFVRRGDRDWRGHYLVRRAGKWLDPLGESSGKKKVAAGGEVLRVLRRDWVPKSYLAPAP